MVKFDGKVIEALGWNQVKVENREYDLTLEFQKTSTERYIFKSMNGDDLINFVNVSKSVNYGPKKHSHWTLRK